MNIRTSAVGKIIAPAATAFAVLASNNGVFPAPKTLFSALAN
jgi:hypothetical protein